MTDLESRPTTAKSINTSGAISQFIAQAAPPSDSTLLGLFDVLRDSWFDKKSSGDAPDITHQVSSLATELGLERQQEFAEAFQLLIRGAAATPHENRVQALYQARTIARLLISSHRVGSSFDEYDLPDIVGFSTVPASATSSSNTPAPTRSKAQMESDLYDYDVDFELAV